MIKYKHLEAFCLMIYQCASCGTLEILWNSRDGVTPFGIGCRQCTRGIMDHILWSHDVRLPDYKPFKGQRIFIDSEIAYPKIFDSSKPFVTTNPLEKDKDTEYEPKIIIFEG